MDETGQHGGGASNKIPGVPPEDPREQQARNSPRAVIAAFLLAAIVLGAASLFAAVLFSRACR
jgi:hypothetical protein